MSQGVEEAKPVAVYAAFNPETGECMAPTIFCDMKLTVATRDRFYKGCPIHECWLSPLYPKEDVNKVAKDWAK